MKWGIGYAGAVGVMLLALAIIIQPTRAQETQSELPQEVLFVVDSSASMAAGFETTSKINALRTAMEEVFDVVPNSVNVGVRTFGSSSPSQEKDCRDTALAVSVDNSTSAVLNDSLESLSPTGVSPLGFTLSRSRNDLSLGTSPKAIVVLTSGADSCSTDPCAIARGLADQRPDITIHTIGLDVEGDVTENVSCISEGSNGVYENVSSQSDLLSALDQVTQRLFDVRLASVVAAELLNEQTEEVVEDEDEVVEDEDGGEDEDEEQEDEIATCVPAGTTADDATILNPGECVGTISQDQYKYYGLELEEGVRLTITADLTKPEDLEKSHELDVILYNPQGDKLGEDKPLGGTIVNRETESKSISFEQIISQSGTYVVEFYSRPYFRGQEEDVAIPFTFTVDVQEHEIAQPKALQAVQEANENAAASTEPERTSFFARFSGSMGGLFENYPISGVQVVVIVVGLILIGIIIKVILLRRRAAEVEAAKVAAELAGKKPLQKEETSE